MSKAKQMQMVYDVVSLIVSDKLFLHNGSSFSAKTGVLKKHCNKLLKKQIFYTQFVGFLTPQDWFHICTISSFPFHSLKWLTIFKIQYIK